LFVVPAPGFEPGLGGF